MLKFGLPPIWSCYQLLLHATLVHQACAHPSSHHFDLPEQPNLNMSLLATPAAEPYYRSMLEESLHPAHARDWIRITTWRSRLSHVLSIRGLSEVFPKRDLRGANWMRRRQSSKRTELTLNFWPTIQPAAV